ncbi:MAG: hypothetical protein ACI378_00070 [Bacteroides sp.]
MKAKYLLTAMALPLLAACTQDEFSVQDNANNAAALKNRVKVGQVAFTNVEDEAETRLDYKTATWNDGDKFGLFLMDEWNYDFEDWHLGQDEGENENANSTWFMEQHIWNKMYHLSDYYQTNFPFTFNKSRAAWENDDAIVEGNYFAVAPANNQQDHLKKLTNRRDLWLYINPVQTFTVANASKNAPKADHIALGGIDENQFSVGYTQIYRNQELTDGDVLQLPIKMQQILGMVDLAISNKDEMPFRVEKIVINRLDGSPMPTLAYVKPYTNSTPEYFGMRQDDGEKLFAQQWAKMATDDNIAKFEARYPGQLHEYAGWQEDGAYEEFGPAFAQPYITDPWKNSCGKWDACGDGSVDYYWTIDSWTRSAARSTVTYSYPGHKGFIPYGCTGEQAQPAYEYVLKFTDGTNDYVELNTSDFIRAFVALPHSMYLREYAVTIYGQQYDNARDEWKEGIILPDFKGQYVLPVEGTTATENDGRFTLQNIDLCSEASYLPADIQFDDFRVGRSRIVQTTNSEDLLKHLKSYYGDKAQFDQNKNVLFYVETMGEFVVTNELVNYVQMLYNNYGITQGSKALIYFTRTTGDNGQGELVFPANLTNDHAIDLFYYSKQVSLRNEGVQVIDKPILYDYNESGIEFTKSIVASLENIWKDRGIFNDGVDLLDKIEPVIADNLFGGIKHITNAGTLTIRTLVTTPEKESDREAIYNLEGATLNLDGAFICGGYVHPDVAAGPNIESIILPEAVIEPTYIHNDGELNSINSVVAGTVENNNVTNIKPLASFIANLINKNDCSNCGDRIAVVNIEAGATLYVYFGTNHKGALIEDYGHFRIVEGSNISGEFNNDGTINVHAGATAITEDAVLKNHATGVINVDGEKGNTGELKENIQNSGTIYVKNYGHVIVDGIVNSEKNGIIDVTEAAGEDTDANAAKDMQSGERNANHFRYVVKASTTAKDLDNALKARISSNNYREKGSNSIIVIFDCQAGQMTYSGDAASNIQHVLVENGTLTLDKSTLFAVLENNSAAHDHDDDLVAYKAFEVARGAELIVANYATLTLGHCDGKEVKVYVEGKFKVNNHGVLAVAKGTKAVTVHGNGYLEFNQDTTKLAWGISEFQGSKKGDQ